MPVVTTILYAAILLWVRLFSSQLLLYAAWERITAQYPPEKHGDLGRECGIPESTRTMQDGSHPGKAMEATKSKILGLAASFGKVQQAGLEVG